MCGIVAYLGFREDAASLLVTGLERLEYRGYDSAGLAVIDTTTNNTTTSNIHAIHVRKRVGKVAELKKLVHSSPVRGTTGIAHTRCDWNNMRK